MRSRPGVCAIAACWLWLGLSPGQASELDPDVERAQRLFLEGAAAYEAREYERALEHMEAARRLHPAAAFDYNIARCHDRLGRESEALREYEHYLVSDPSGSESAVARTRIEVLRRRLEAQRQRRARYLAPGVMAGVSAALLVVGAGLAGSVPSAYEALDARWRAVGPTPELVGDADALRGRELAGYAMLGLGGAAVVVDIALWIVATRRGSPGVRAAFLGGVRF